MSDGEASGAAATGAASVPRAAIHDLGYKRYLGTRRPQSTRWRVIVRNQVSVAWRGFWRVKVWGIGAAMTTAVFGILMYVSRQEEIFEFLATRATGEPLTFADGILPWSFFVYPWFAFVLSVSLAAAVVPRDLQVGAFEFYFSRPVRPRDYVVGKLVAMWLIMALILVAGPLLLALLRVGLADPSDMLATLVVVPKALAVGLLAALAYAALPLAFGALTAKPRNAIAIWTAYYLIAGGIFTSVGHAIDVPALAALNPHQAVQDLAFALFDVAHPVGQGGMNAPWWAALAALVGYTALGFGATLWRVEAAERAGLGGG